VDRLWELTSTLRQDVGQMNRMNMPHVEYSELYVIATVVCKHEGQRTLCFDTQCKCLNKDTVMLEPYAVHMERVDMYITCKSET
jgi:hypothetical protein